MIIKCITRGKALETVPGLGIMVIPPMRTATSGILDAFSQDPPEK